MKMQVFGCIDFNGFMNNVRIYLKDKRERESFIWNIMFMFGYDFIHRIGSQALDRRG